MADATVASQDTLNQHWKQNKSGFGFKMLQKMGWKEDRGLGKHESGIVSNVKLQKREAGLGLGMSEDKVGNGAWSETVSSFNDVLTLLKENYGRGADVADDESNNRKKKDKKKKKDKVVKSSSTASLNSLASTSTSSTRISVGMKYKRMREAKDLSSKSLQDKAAIFGAAYDPPSSSGASAGAMAWGLGDSGGVQRTKPAAMQAQEWSMGMTAPITNMLGASSPSPPYSSSSNNETVDTSQDRSKRNKAKKSKEKKQ